MSTSEPLEIPESDENENWLNIVRGTVQRSVGPKQAESTAGAVTMSANQAQPGTDDDVIVGIVQKFRSGQLPFKEALAALGATSLTWQEAQILLAQ